LDAETAIVVSAPGDGTIHIFKEDSPDKFSVVEPVILAPTVAPVLDTRSR